MRKFYGTVIGDRQETNATRRGFQYIRAAVQSWDGSIITELTERQGKLMLEVRHSETSSVSGDRIWEGELTEFVDLLKGGKA